MKDYLSGGKDFSSLSLPELLAARDQFHLHLMQKANVIGTAVGKYRIRKSDPWPDKAHPEKDTKPGGKPKPARTLENSEVRPYSWPAILVFVKRWLDPDAFDSSGGLDAGDFIPPAVYLPDGDKVPLCVVEALNSDMALPGDGHYMYPSNLIGGGYPILAEVQNEEHVASIGCLITDGHLTYAITNRHVCGAAGEPIYSLLNGNRVQIGVSSAKFLSRLKFEVVYPEWPGKNVWVNLDIGLIEITDKDQWTTQVYGIGEIGDLADLSTYNLTLRLIGAPVRAFGAASKQMAGEVCALFYRYKAVGGFEYVADFLIGPRAGSTSLGTHPGDSGTLWLLDREETKELPMPLALQWGGQVFLSGGDQTGSSYALATCLSNVCSRLNVEIIRDWNIGEKEYWGAVGHYSIANKACGVVQNANLHKLMNNNLPIITFDVANINKKNLSGLSKLDFVPLADVPDMVWKVGPHKRGGLTSPEHSNHFADMDRDLNKPIAEGSTLLEICDGKPQNVAVDVWQRYYDAVQQQFPAEQESRGLLPFRVWQFYQGMVEFVRSGDVDKFVCAAGIVSHYIGDACQPLHISYLFNGDPDHKVPGMVRDPKTGQKVEKPIPEGTGVHSAYEDDMVDNHVPEIMQGVDATLAAASPLPKVTGGHEAAVAVVELMQRTFNAIQPREILDAFLPVESEKPKPRADALWNTEVRGSKLGDRTIEVMADGCLCLAQIWESAWAEGDGDTNITQLGVVTEPAMEQLYQNPDFMPSHTLDTIGPLLTNGASSGGSTPQPKKKKKATSKKSRKKVPA